MLTTTDTQSTEIHSWLTSHLYDCVVFPVKTPTPPPDHTNSHLCSHPYCPSINIPTLWQGCQCTPPQVGEGRKMRGDRGRERKQALVWERIFERANSYSGWKGRARTKESKEKWVGGRFPLWKTWMQHDSVVWRLFAFFFSLKTTRLDFATRDLHLRQNYINLLKVTFSYNCILSVHSGHCLIVLLSPMMQ